MSSTLPHPPPTSRFRRDRPDLHKTPATVVKKTVEDIRLLCKTR